MLQQTLRDALALEAQKVQWALDPVKWARERAGEFLWSKQREVFQSIADNPRTLVTSCHGAGKSFIASRAIAWWIDTRGVTDSMVVSTAPTYPQVHMIVWEELRKLHAKAGLIGTVTQGDRWRVGDYTCAFGRKPSDTSESAFQGIHARSVLGVIDEACGIPETLWTGAEAITTGSDCRILAIGNPDDPTSPFYNKMDTGLWHVIKISAFDTPNLTGEKIPDHIKPKLVSKEWVDDRRIEWGEEHPLWKSRVLGEFPAVDDFAMVSRAKLNEAVNNFKAWPAVDMRLPTILGVDVARFGGDSSVIALRRGNKVAVAQVVQGMDTMGLCGIISRWVREVQAAGSYVAAIQVDGVGLGAGVVDRLRELGHPVVDLQSSAKPSPTLEDTFVNARAEWWFQLKHALKEGRIALKLPPDAYQELTSIGYGYDSSGRIKVDSKDDIRKKINRSPDVADAIVYAWATPPVKALSSTTSKLW